MPYLLFSRVKRFGTTEEGQALVFVAFGLMMLLMMAALGVDVGYLHYQRQQMQKAADAAAIAGATALSYNGNFAIAAQSDASANGFVNGNGGVSVAVHNPPVTAGDPFQGNGQYVEVVITKPQPTFFLNVTNFGNVNVRARAVANARGVASGCIYALDPSDSQTLVVDSGATVQTTCSIYVESSNASALQNNGTLAVGGPNYQTVGTGVVASGYSGSGSYSPTPTTDIPPFNDPLGTVTTPTSTSCNYTNFSTNNGNNGQPIQSGTYCGGITVTGGTLQLSPGIYTIAGGSLNVSGTGQINGTGVTFVVTANLNTHVYTGVNIAGNISLSAPSSGPLAGILFIQDRTIAAGSAPSTFDATGNAIFTGALYFPTTKVQFKGTAPNLTSYSPIVAYQVEFLANSTLATNRLLNNSGPVPGAVLVE